MIVFILLCGCSKAESKNPLLEKQLAAQQFILSFEGFIPVAQSDGKGKRHSLGYGTIGKKGETITEHEAARRMNVYLIDHVFSKLDDNLSRGKYIAFASFAYNTGVTPKTCDKLLQKKYQLPGTKWEKGLKRRRNSEYKLCMEENNVRKETRTVR